MEHTEESSSKEMAFLWNAPKLMMIYTNMIPDGIKELFYHNRICRMKYDLALKHSRGMRSV